MIDTRTLTETDITDIIVPCIRDTVISGMNAYAWGSLGYAAYKADDKNLRLTVAICAAFAFSNLKNIFLYKDAADTALGSRDAQISGNALDQKPSYEDKSAEISREAKNRLYTKILGVYLGLYLADQICSLAIPISLEMATPEIASV